MANIDLAEALRDLYLNEENVERKPNVREIELLKSLLHDPLWENQAEARAVLDVLIGIATDRSFVTTADNGLALKHMAKLTAHMGVFVGLLEPLGATHPNDA